MNAALFLLLRLRFGGWWRRLRRNVGTVRGAVFVVAGLLMTGCWVSALLFSPRDTAPADEEQVRRFVPLFLLGYCLLTALTSARDRSLTFSPAEVNFLFAAPFTRRQILLYKIVAAALGTLLSSLVFSVLARGYATSFVAAFIAMFLALLFLQLFGIAVALLSETIGVQASDARRKLGFVLVGLVAAAVLVSVGRDFFGLRPMQWLERAEASPVVRVLLLPFQSFADAFTAKQLWPDLTQRVLLCLLIDGILLAIVLLLDAHYLEAASAASERVYRRLERMRAGPAAAMSSGGNARFTLPDWPRWGGVGPLAWRQALTALRNLKGLAFIVLTFGCFLVVPFAVQREEQPVSALLPRTMSGTIFGMSILLMQLLSFDFRGDLDRMEVLKSLPIPPLRVALGQLFTPVAMACVLQGSSFAVIQVTLGGLGEYLVAILLFLPLFNLLLFGVMNLLFLWFPTRLTPSTAGDFQMMGRQAMLFFAIYAIVFLLLLIPVLGGTLLLLLAEWDWRLCATVSWFLLAGIVAGLMPLLALAFRQFDVSRDVPA